MLNKLEKAAGLYNKLLTTVSDSVRADIYNEIGKISLSIGRPTTLIHPTTLILINCEEEER